MIKLQHLLKAVVDQRATDLHIVAGAPPALRVNGRIARVKHPVLSKDDTKMLIYEILNDAQKARLEEQKEIDISFEIKKVSRFRANVFKQQDCISAAFRRIPQEIPSYVSLGLPSIVGDFTKKSYGMILVTGPTGSGKTTTIASLIDKVNAESYGHIVTIEDPIEYLYPPKNCIVNQRELGPDTWSYQTAVKSLLRQDPDVCLIGELRDLETVEAAIKIAETGHLVFATLHTNTAAQTLSRITNLYPSGQQERVRTSLSMIVQGILSQRLLPGLDGRLQLASEVLVSTPAVRNLIREGKFQQLTSAMQSGQDASGMMLMNQSLVGLLLNRKIDLKTAYEVSPDPEELDRTLKKAGV